MTSAELIPAYELAKTVGIKAGLYGPAGSGKSPLLDSLKNGFNPVVCVAEPAYKSMAFSGIACYRANTFAEVQGFANWWIGSAEARTFGVACIDSASEAASLTLKEHLGRGSKGGNEAHGKRAYGQLAQDMRELIDKLYFAPGLHCLFIFHEEMRDDGMKNLSVPGQDLKTFIPHRLDWVAHVEDYGQQKVLRNRAGAGAFARERTGRLAELEAFDLANCFSKLLA